MENKVYAFQYCDCIHESTFFTMSLHRTKKGAEIAMEFHKEQERKEHEAMYEGLSKEHKKGLYVEFGKHEAWQVIELEIQE